MTIIADAPTPFTLHGALKGVQRTLPVALSGATYGFVFGVLARQVGLSWTETLLMSALVNAGGSQFAAIGMWGLPVPVANIVLTTFIVNLRNILMGASLRRWLAPLPARRAYSLAFFISDESWALTIREFASGCGDAAFLLGSGLTLFSFWVGSSVLGNLVGAVIPNPALWGLDFAFTAVFAALLAGMWKSRSTLWPWVVAAAVAILTARWLPGQWFVVLGGLAGAIVGTIQDGA